MNKTIENINKNQCFVSSPLLSIKQRKNLLKKLKETIYKNELLIYESFKNDLNKSKKETYLTEVSEVIAEIEMFIKKINKWSKDKKVKSSYQTYGTKSKLVYKPQGKVLIIVPFNYPFVLCFNPLIGAFASGNKILIKLSEWTKNINKVIVKIINETFSKDVVDVILDSDLKNYNEIYEYNPNLVFFTGSTKVGKIIEGECVKRNINYVTELGGKCPCLVMDINSKNIYKRIVWSKFLNAGQVCVGINHIIYNENINNFKENLIDEIKIQYPNVLNMKNIPKLINEHSFNRLVNIIEENKDNIIYGGQYNKEDLIIEPTVIEVSIEKIQKYDELFGPILLITKAKDDLSQIIKDINSIDNSPLAAYIYTNNKKYINFFVHNINAGGYGINDSVIHISNSNLPFGGTYTSGTGRYHGKYSFETFSFIKPVLINKSKNNIQIKFINNKYGYEKTKKLINIIKKIIH